MDERKVIHSGGPRSNAEEQNMLCIQKKNFMFLSCIWQEMRV